MKLTISVVLILAAVVWATILIVADVRGEYAYEASIASYWSLADKSSTITQKSQYVDKFVEALERQGLQGKYNAIIYPTPDNSFDRNMEALKSLQGRLREIQTMNPASFEYQTAMQQITGQEQGEAKAMLNVFEGVWWKEHHLALWDWVYVLQVLSLFVLGGIGGCILISWSMDY